MNDKLGGLHGESQSTTEPTRTNIELYNPNHPDNSERTIHNNYEQFQAAREAMGWGSKDFRREVLVGEFLIGVQKAYKGGDPDYLLDVVSSILEKEVTIDED